MNKMSQDDVKECFNLYYNRLYLFALRMVNCKETARDLAQDAFVVLMEAQKNIFDDPRAIKSYLYTTVKHAALNRIRHNKIVNANYSKDPVVEMEDEKITQSMIHAEIVGELYAALEALPEGCRKICKLGYLEGRKNFEIAELLNISINTVRAQKQKGLRILRDRLSPLATSVLLYLMSR